MDESFEYYISFIGTDQQMNIELEELKTLWEYFNSITSGENEYKIDERCYVNEFDGAFEYDIFMKVKCKFPDAAIMCLVFKDLKFDRTSKMDWMEFYG